MLGDFKCQSLIIYICGNNRRYLILNCGHSSKNILVCKTSVRYKNWRLNIDIICPNHNNVSHLVHWLVLGRLVDYLSPDQQFVLFSKCPTAAARKEINAKHLVITGDSIVRHLFLYLNFIVPVICAPGVRICSPDKYKCLVCFWMPVLEALIRHQKPHFAFHLGKNKVPV